MNPAAPSRAFPVNHNHVGGAVPTEQVHTEKATFTWVIPPVTVSANEEFFDIFNGSNNVIRLQSILAVASIDEAATATLGVRLHLCRTSAVGTGGTAWDTTPTTIGAAGGGLSKHDTSIDDIGAAISGRQQPTGGATLEAWLATKWTALEESGPPQALEVELLPKAEHGQDWALRINQGMKVVQGSVPSAGKVGFLVTFTVE